MLGLVIGKIGVLLLTW